MNCPKAGVALIIRKNDKVLLGKRKGNHAPNTWGFPGGHLEMWESFKNAALRELKEEVGSAILVTEPKLLTVTNALFYNEKKTLYYHLYGFRLDQRRTVSC